MGQASYGEADVGTYCPGLPHCTPERWTDEQRMGRRRGREGKGREGTGGREGGEKKRQKKTDRMREGKREINGATCVSTKAYLQDKKSAEKHFLTGDISSSAVEASKSWEEMPFS